MRLAVILLVANCAWAQRGTGELRLTVKDAQGSGLAAAVELTSDASHTRENLTLPPNGQFNFKSLPFGIYRLQIAHQGFATSSEVVEIRSEIPQSRTVTLGIQPIETSVSVTAPETLLDPNRTGGAYYVGAQQIQERPTAGAGRDLTNLVVMQPGWAVEANGILHPRESEYDTQFIINGFPVQDNRSPAFARPVGAEDAGSMKIYTSGIPAEFGNKLGGVIEVNTGRNTAPGFHGTAVAQGGSFDTAGGYLSAQYVAGRSTATVSTEGFLTGRFLDPPVQANYSNHASSSLATGTWEQDFTDSDRVRVSFTHQRTGFLVPNDLLQQAAGQRQDRDSAASEGQVSYQRIISASLLGVVRASVRDVSAGLWSNPLTTPIAAHQDRGLREAYVNGSLSGHWGRHEWKTGAEARFGSIREEFGFHIVAYKINGFRVFDKDLPATYEFAGHGQDREQAVYVQDSIRLGDFTVSAGLRFDHYRLLVDESGVSPRLGISWHSKPLGLVLHASYDRVFGTPPFENILVSAAPQSRLNGGFYLPLLPSRGNYYEGGFTQQLGKRIRLDANYFRRNVRDFKDDDLLVNTGVSFPIAFARAEIRGTEVKLEVPRWGAFSGFLSYSNTIGTAQFPISGGLFLDDTAAANLASQERFPITQDQRNTARAWLRYQILPRLWTAWTASYNSGLPSEGADQLPPTSFLISEYGAPILRKVNFSRDRVNPSFSLDASVGVDLWKREKRSVSLQGDILNLTNRLNVINFVGLLSGTALAPPRSFGMRLRAEF